MRTVAAIVLALSLVDKQPVRTYDYNHANCLCYRDCYSSEQRIHNMQ
jgi:hypothetical protein